MASQVARGAARPNEVFDDTLGPTSETIGCARGEVVITGQIRMTGRPCVVAYSEMEGKNGSR